MNIGGAIKELRKAAGYNQEELAARSNTGQTYLSQIEGNKKDASIKQLQDIANALNVPLALIFVMAIDRQDTVIRHNPDDALVQYALEEGKKLLLKAL